MSDKLGVCEIENCCGTTCDRSEVERGITLLQNDLAEHEAAAVAACELIDELIELVQYHPLDDDVAINKLQKIKSCLE